MYYANQARKRFQNEDRFINYINMLKKYQFNLEQKMPLSEFKPSPLFPVHFVSKNEQGEPTFKASAAEFNAKSFIHLSTTEKEKFQQNLLADHVKGFEYALRNSETDKMTLQFDLKGFSWAHVHRSTINLGLAIMNFDSEYYPSRMSAINVINAPWYFPTIWKWTSSFILPQYREIIYFQS